jgi:hypothetical protein
MNVVAKPKNREDFKKCIPEYNQLTECLSRFRAVIDTGKLAEFYCCKIFDLKLVTPHNSTIDAMSSTGERIEIKHRFFSGKVPPGMKINLQNIDYVLYVELNDDLIPKQIYKIHSKDIYYTTGSRVSFKKAFKEDNAELLFQW